MGPQPHHVRKSGGQSVAIGLGALDMEGRTWAEEPREPRPHPRGEAHDAEQPGEAIQEAHGEEDGLDA